MAVFEEEDGYRTYFKISNLRTDKKLHEIYRELYGCDFDISRGYELESYEYQIRLARVVLKKIQMEVEELPVKFVLRIRNGILLYRGKKTKSEVIKKWKLDEHV